jgi:large subunit ribosomal protein L17
VRHKRAGYKLGRTVAARRMLLRNLVTSVLDKERVITTVPKAKAARPWVEKMISLAKEDTLPSRRRAAAFLKTPGTVKKLFDTLGARFGQRTGGYTRIVRLGPRKGDGAEQAMIELVGSELVKRAAERARRKEERLKAMREGRAAEEEEGGETPPS